MKKIFLVFPPSFTYFVGGPYLSLPILSGFLRGKGIEVRMIDLNILFSVHLGVFISEEEAKNAVEKGFIHQERLLEEKEGKFKSVAKKFNGDWDLRFGFYYNYYYPSSSESVKEALLSPSPFDDFFRNNFLPLVSKEKPDVVAFSIVDVTQIIPTFQLIKLLRMEGFGGRVVLGGNIVSRLGKDLLKKWVFELIDFAVLFQGEPILYLLMKNLDKEHLIQKIPNLFWKDSQGNLRENEYHHFNVADIVPPPNFDDFVLQNYWGINYLPLSHLRGCPWGRCPFCPIPYGWGNKGFGGKRSLENVLLDMKTLYDKYGVEKFQFVDEAFPTRSAYILASKIKNESLPFVWEIFSRIEAGWSDYRKNKLLYEGGLRKVYLGLEIFPSQNRKALNKGDRGEWIEKIIDALYEAGIKVHLFCLFGFPGTSVRDAVRTIEFIVKKQNEIDTVDINPFVFYRHTKPQYLEKIVSPFHDWALEYEYVNTYNNLSSKDIKILSFTLEKILWREKPTLLHPIYRLVSPWI